MERYQYKFLSRSEPDTLSIRLVRLHHGNSDDEICISVLEHLLPTIHNLNYAGVDDQQWFALSYTWGDLNDVANVTVQPDDNHAEAETRFITVTKNLAIALRAMRQEKSDRLLWIDAICINQGTDKKALDERAWQVSNMHHIYQRASGVVIWLGPEADDSNYVMHGLHDLGHTVRVDEITFEVYHNGDQSQLKRWATSEESHRLQQGFFHLLQREWFDRVWIRQEAFFAKEETSIVQIGDTTLYYSLFRKGIRALVRVGIYGGNAVNVRYSLALAVTQRTFSTVPELLRKSRLSQCRDARDKVYGMLGIQEATSAPGRAMRVPVSYEADHSTERVYADFFQLYTEHWVTLKLLDEGGLWQRSEAISSGQLASWVPDWRCPSEDYQLDLSMETATGHLVMAECQFLDTGVLRVYGRSPVRVTHVHPLEAVDDLLAFGEIATLMRTHLTEVDIDLAVERMTYALYSFAFSIGDTIENIENGRTKTMEYIHYLATTDLSEEIKHPDSMLEKDHSRWLILTLDHLRNKDLVFLFVEGNYVGICPSMTQPDDRIYAILGSRALLLLRPTSNASQYQLVGPCYVHHLNWGEALLGPLHPRYTVVQRYDPTRGGFVPKYMDTEKTGPEAESMWDPRINWVELDAHPPMLSFVRVAAPPGEPLRERPDSEYLKRHGIQVETIHLV